MYQRKENSICMDGTYRHNHSVCTYKSLLNLEKLNNVFFCCTPEHKAETQCHTHKKDVRTDGVTCVVFVCHVLPAHCHPYT